MPSYYYTKFQKNPCVGRNERCPLIDLRLLVRIGYEIVKRQDFIKQKEKKNSTRLCGRKNIHQSTHTVHFFP